MATSTTTPITSLAQLDPEGVYTYADWLTLRSSGNGWS